MKYPKAYYLMLLYITVMLKPLLPIVTDWYEHEFNSIQHEIKVHMVYGNHHLDKDLAESNLGGDDNKKHTTPKVSEPVSVHIVVQILYTIPQPTADKQKFSVNICKVSTVSLDKHYPPPKCC